MWNIAADGHGRPVLPGTNSCGNGGCRAVVTVNNDGSYNLNQECTFFYALIIPRLAKTRLIPQFMGLLKPTKLSFRAMSEDRGDNVLMLLLAEN